MEDKRINPVVVFGIVAAIVFIIFTIWFIANSSTPEYKYGDTAVEDAKTAIFAADQYLDGKMDKRSYELQIHLCQEDVEVGEKAYDIYQTIKYMDNTLTDYNVLKHRNELADLIGEKKR